MIRGTRVTPLKLPQGFRGYNKGDVDRTRRLIEQLFNEYALGGIQHLSQQVVALEARIAELEGGGVSPPDVGGGAVYWYDASQLTAAEGDDVMVWPNLVSPSSFSDLTLTNAKYTSAGINGHPSLWCLPASGGGGFGDFLPDPPYTLFLVAHLDIDWTMTNGNSFSMDLASVLGVGTSDPWTVTLFLDSGVFTTGQQPAPGMHIFAVVIRAVDDYDVVIDGVKYTGSTPNVPGAQVEAFITNAAQNAQAGFLQTVFPGENLLYASALSDADRESVEAYLTTKWS